MGRGWRCAAVSAAATALLAPLLLLQGAEPAPDAAPPQPPPSGAAEQLVLLRRLQSEGVPHLDSAIAAVALGLPGGAVKETSPPRRLEPKAAAGTAAAAAPPPPPDGAGQQQQQPEADEDLVLTRQLWAEGALLGNISAAEAGGQGVWGALRSGALRFRDGSDSPFRALPAPELLRALHATPCWQATEVRSRVELVTVNRNRARLLVEWVAHHLVVGVSHVFVYDDASSDNAAEALRPFIEAGLVTWRRGLPWDEEVLGSFDPLARYQLESFLDWLRRRREGSSAPPAAPGPTAGQHLPKGVPADRVWVGLLDQDEFVLPTATECLHELADRALGHRASGALYLPWTRLGHANVTDYGMLRNATVLEAAGPAAGAPDTGCITRQTEIIHGLARACWSLGKSLARLGAIPELDDTTLRHFTHTSERDHLFPHLVPLRDGLRTTNERGWALPTSHEVQRCDVRVTSRGMPQVTRRMLVWKQKCEQVLTAQKSRLERWLQFRQGRIEEFPTVVVHARSNCFASLVRPALDKGRQSHRHGLAKRRSLSWLYRSFMLELGRGFVPMPAERHPLFHRRIAAVRRLLRIGALAPARPPLAPDAMLAQGLVPALNATPPHPFLVGR